MVILGAYQNKLSFLGIEFSFVCSHEVLNVA